MTTEKEALPKEIEMLDPGYEWVYLKEAWAQYLSQAKGTDVSLGTLRGWCVDKKYGIISGYAGGRIVVRADTIPTIRPIE